MWCGPVLEPRVQLPASDASVALYLQVVVNDAKSFAPVKAASAAIAFFQKFGLNLKNRKEPFEWDNVVLFVEAYGVRQKGYCHLVVASMAVVMFGAMCRYDDASGLK